MKEVRKLFLVILLFVFLSSGVLAVEYGNCSVVERNSCVAANKDNIVLGLSALTNAHAQLPIIGTYNYVLCCNFGKITADITCVTSPTSNKVIGLSATTNAHVEYPGASTYSTSACYEDFVCGKYTACPSGYIGVLSISADTNAHVGEFNAYPTKICCGGESVSEASCTIKTVEWGRTEATITQGVPILVTGSGSECNGMTVSFDVREQDITNTQEVTTNPVNVAFSEDSATGIWYAEWQDDIGNPEYKVNVSLVRVPQRYLESSNELTVKKDDTACASIATCANYNTESLCEDDACGVAEVSGLPDVECGAGDICGCSWEASTSTCKFSWGEINPGFCEDGYTLCNKDGVDYCYPGSICPTGETPDCDGDGICEEGEGCSCLSDCDDGDQDSCVSGATCLSGACHDPTPPIVDIICEYGYTLCRKAGTSKNYCYPGSICPTGEDPDSDGDGKCEPGEGCLSADCNDGDVDSCSNKLYCLSDKCSNVQNPISLGLLSSCRISQIREKDCEEEPAGYKIINWTGTWVGEIKIESDYQKCITGGRTTVPCPAKVQLPFFDYFELVATLVVLAIIYSALLYKKKHHQKKKK